MPDNAIIKLPSFANEIAIPSAWMEKRDKVLAASVEIKAVDNQLIFDDASEILQKITKTSNALESERKKFAKPFQGIVKTIKTVCDNERKLLEEEKTRIKDLLGVYAAKQARAAAEARRKAEEEERKEAERQMAMQAAADELDMDAEPEPIVTVPVNKPYIEEAHSSSARVQRRLIWRIMDEELVPSALKTTDSTKVNEYKRRNEKSIMEKLDNNANGNSFVEGLEFAIKTNVMGR